MNKKIENMPHRSRDGFTIIEVVLVLAIAGLIFLMVFVALPALQKGQRDAQRKQDLSRISVQMSQSYSSSRGVIPDTDSRFNLFVKNYLKGGSGKAGEEYKDPATGSPYEMKFEEDLAAVGQVGYHPKSACDPDSSSGVKTTTAARDYAFTIMLENQNVPFCIDNKSSS